MNLKRYEIIVRVEAENMAEAEKYVRDLESSDDVFIVQAHVNPITK